jgi:hypothetical protein
MLDTRRVFPPPGFPEMIKVLQPSDFFTKKLKNKLSSTNQVIWARSPFKKYLDFAPLLLSALHLLGYVFAH